LYARHDEGEAPAPAGPSGEFSGTGLDGAKYR
jgi:hypothetical protein